jgi:hypothetical protein
MPNIVKKITAFIFDGILKYTLFYSCVFVIFTISLGLSADGHQHLARFISINDPKDFVNLKGAIVNIILTCYEKPPLHSGELCRKTAFSSLQTPDFNFIGAKPPQLQGLNAIFTETPSSRQGANVQRISDYCSYSDGRYKILYLGKNISSERVATCTLQAVLMFLGFKIPSAENGNINPAFFQNVINHYTRSE